MTNRAPIARRLLAAAALMTALAVTGGCAAGPDPARTSSAVDPGHPAADGLPSPHVHGVAVNPADDRVYLASHDGLFRYDPTGPQRVGPVIDLMGFTLAGPDHFYASGHPGQGTDLPDPVGLLESTDAGNTWTVLSRQGQSDFHALTASGTGMILGYDGALAASTDGRAWDELATPAAPYALATSPDGAITLATTAAGLLRSTDAGRNWTPTPDAPPVVLADWVDPGVVTGITADGTVAVSTDTGLTWQLRGTTAPPQAITATTAGNGTLRVVVVTAAEILDSTDGGLTFNPLR